MEMDFMCLGGAEHIWIYGAGIVGKRVLAMLSEPALGLHIEGMVVSRLREGQEAPEGYQVAQITDRERVSRESVFIVAVAGPLQKEIVETLRAEGCSRYILWKSEYVSRRWYLADWRLEDRSRGLAKVCLVLAGYKEFLWDTVFERLRRFVPGDVDVCILSSGVYSGRLSETAQENGWSYLSTQVNDITLIQNIAIGHYEKAEWIYKMDEDIFVTQGCFEELMETYREVEASGAYRICFAAPLIPVNGYGYIRILEHVGKREAYEGRFGRAYYGGYPESMIEKDAGAAQYMWGAEGEIPQLDRLNRLLRDTGGYSICGVRFSIGFILLHRSIWKSMGGFIVTGRLDLGVDEEELCRHGMLYAKAIIVSEGTAVGHFSFGQQTEGMRRFYEKNPRLFQIEGTEGGTQRS